MIACPHCGSIGHAEVEWSYDGKVRHAVRWCESCGMRFRTERPWQGRERAISTPADEPGKGDHVTADPEWLQNLRVRAQKSRLGAIKLFCIDCMGGSRHDAKSCVSRDCALWPHAFKRGKKVSGEVP